MKNFDTFYQFLDDLKKSHNNVLLIEAIQQGYQVCFEAEIDRKYLLSIVGQDGTKVDAAKSKAKALLISPAFKFDSLFDNKEQNNVFIKVVNFIAKLILEDKPIKDEYIDYFHDLVTDKRKSDILAILNNSDITVEELEKKMADYQKIKAEEEARKFTPAEQEEYNRTKVVMKFNDGFAWHQLLDKHGNPKSYCASESKAMNHCGRGQEDDMLYSLRKDNKSVATVAINKNTGELRESKGPRNNKIDLDKYGKHMMWLFKSDIVKGKGGHSYKEEANVNVSDFLGRDEEGIDWIEKNKPSLIDEKYDRIVLNARRKLISGEIEEQDVFDMFKNGELKIYHLKGIIGNKSFYKFITEPLLIELINNNKVKFEDIIQTENKLFTPKIQIALIDQNSGNYENFLNMEKEIENFKIEDEVHKYVFKRDISAIRYLPKENRMEIFNKFPESFAEGFKISPSAIGFFTLENRMEIVNKFPESFAEGFKKDPSAVSYFPEETQMEILNNKEFHEILSEWFKKDPSAIGYFSTKNRMEMLNNFPEILSEWFKINPYVIGFFSPENRMEILNNFPESFSEWFKKAPSSIMHFSKENRMEILNNFPERFAEGFKEDPTAIKYFRPEDQMEIKKMFPDIFKDKP